MNKLWLEAGEMSGGSRNQIEFDEDLAAFFGVALPPVGASIDIAIDVTGKKWFDCGLAAKKTSYGVTIYRLSLPTVARGGPVYPGRVLRFTPKGGRYFQVDVTDDGSVDHSQWEEESRANGTLSRTGGSGRAFGYLATDS